jgi:hypothetical protein
MKEPVFWSVSQAITASCCQGVKFLFLRHWHYGKISCSVCPNGGRLQASLLHGKIIFQVLSSSRGSSLYQQTKLNVFAKQTYSSLLRKKKIVL